MRQRRPSAPRRQLKLLRSDFEPDESDTSAAVLERMSAEDLFGYQCQNYGLPPVARKLRFAQSLGRRWEFDYAFPAFKVAVEIDGICVLPRCRRCYPRELVVLGRHASVTGIRGDREKYNAAALLQWYLLRFEPQDVTRKYAIQQTIRILAAHGWLQETPA